jgi:hypothetical protein
MNTDQTQEQRYRPGEPGDLFDLAYDPRATVILNPGGIECKACATELDTPTQAEMQAHANKPQRLSDGSIGTCAEFWGVNR